MSSRDAPIAPPESTQSRGEFREFERLRQIVISAGVEPAHAIVDGIPRGQQQDGQTVGLLTQPAAQFEPGHPGKHDVENGDVVGLLVGKGDAVDAVVGEVDRVALAAQSSREECSHLGLVIDDQDAQGHAVHLPLCCDTTARPRLVR